MCIRDRQPGHAEQRTHDYVRHGTTTLFAALNVATGTVTGVCKQRHRHQEFLAFLKHVARAYPDTGDGTRIHLAMDNYATHKRPEVRDWLAANPRFQAHFTPTCLLYTSDAADEEDSVDLGGRRII